MGMFTYLISEMCCAGFDCLWCCESTLKVVKGIQFRFVSVQHDIPMKIRTVSPSYIRKLIRNSKCRIYCAVLLFLNSLLWLKLNC